MGYTGAECLDQYLKTLYNWTSSSTCELSQSPGACLMSPAVEESEFGSPAEYNLTTLARSAKVILVSSLPAIY